MIDADTQGVAPDRDIDKKWIRVAKRRLQEIRLGKVNPVSGEEVFAKVRERFDL